MKKEEVEAMEGRLAEMTRRIDELKERLGTAREEVKTELAKRIDAVSGDQEEQRRRLHRLKDAGLDQWDTVIDQANRAWEGLEQSLQDLAATLKR